MRTQVSQTSLSAYRSLSNAALTGTELEVMAVMNDGVARTRRQIADELGWRDGPTCGRCNSLVAKKALISVGEQKNPESNKYAELLQIPPQNPQGVLFQ